ncbi:MAG: Gfo/Idh/MocA family protein [Vicinamibacterales bacterium]
MRAATRCGIVGFGRIGRLYHTVIEQVGPHVGLSTTAIADPNLEGLSPPGVERFLAQDTMLAANAVDAALIATPPSDHFALAMDALDAGQHVLVEKPPARTPAEAVALLAKARSVDRTLFFAYHAQYNPAIEWLRRRVQSHDISSIRIEYKEHVQNFHDAGSWVIREGVLRDSGINTVSLLTSLLGQRRLVVTAARLKQGPQQEADVAAGFDCSFDTGAAHVSLDWAFPGPEERTVFVLTSHGTYVADVTHGTVDQDGIRLFTAPAAAGMLQAEYEGIIAAFAAAVEQRRCVASPTELLVLEEIYKRAARV